VIQLLPEDYENLLSLIQRLDEIHVSPREWIERTEMEVGCLWDSKSMDPSDGFDAGWCVGYLRCLVLRTDRTSLDILNELKEKYDATKA